MSCSKAWPAIASCATTSSQPPQPGRICREDGGTGNDQSVTGYPRDNDFMTFRRRRRVDFGCAYCRDDQNRLFGHVRQIASNEERGTILLQCLRCDALYENTPRGPDNTKRLTEAEAQALFPDFRS